MVEEERPKVGVGVLVFKDGKILLGQRKNAHGNGAWGGPGGHLEFGESYEECAIRETREETGIEIENPRVISLGALRWPTKHYVDIGVAADWKSGEPTLREPDKCAEWQWCDLNKLPQNLFGGVPSYLEALRTGQFHYGMKEFQS